MSSLFSMFTTASTSARKRIELQNRDLTISVRTDVRESNYEVEDWFELVPTDQSREQRSGNRGNLKGFFAESPPLDRG